MLTRAGLTRAVMAVAGLILALTAAGCTSAPPPVDPSAAVAPDPGPPSVRDRLVTLVVGAYASPEDIEEGGCFADEVLAEVGEDELVEAGVLDPENIEGMLPRLPRRMIDPWVSAQFDCIDHVKLATRTQTFTAGGQVDVLAYSSCYGRKVTEEQSRQAARAVLMRKLQGPAWEAVRAAEESCSREARLNQ